MKNKYITLDYNEYLEMEDTIDRAMRIISDILDDEDVPEEVKDWVRRMAKALGW